LSKQGRNIMIGRDQQFTLQKHTCEDRIDYQFVYSYIPFLKDTNNCGVSNTCTGDCKQPYQRTMHSEKFVMP
jgi:hypothetical protein